MAPWTLLASSSTAPLPPAVPLWAQQYQPRYKAVVNNEGNFNGTCTMTEESIPLLLEDNMCASWFLDVTVFCCGAVGGNLEESKGEHSSTVNDNTTQSYFEPVCVTTNYRDMLDCYRVTSINSCSSKEVAPYGICNARLMDTSRTVSKSSTNGSNNAAIKRAPHRVVLFFLILFPVLYASF